MTKNLPVPNWSFKSDLILDEIDSFLDDLVADIDALSILVVKSVNLSDSSLLSAQDLGLHIEEVKSKWVEKSSILAIRLQEAESRIRRSMNRNKKHSLARFLDHIQIKLRFDSKVRDMTSKVKSIIDQISRYMLKLIDRARSNN